MPTPTYRTPVRIARGTYANLNSSIADILEGEVVYATDQDKLYVKENNALVNTQADLSGYLTSATAASTYQTQAGMTTYLTTSAAGSTYAPLASPTFTGTVTIPAGASISGYAALASAQSFTAAQRGAYVTLTDAATIDIDLSLGNQFQVTLGGNRTLGAPTNVVAGQSGVIRVVQDGTGSRTLAYNSIFKFPGGTAPTLTTAASSVDLLAYHVESSTRIAVRFIGDVK